MQIKTEAKKEPEIRNRSYRFTLSVFIFLVSFLLLRFFVFPLYQIPSGSMEPTLMIGDCVCTEKISYFFGSVKPGDIVTFVDSNDSSRTLIKRCIAVGGQTVDLQDGVVVVDNVRLDESYTNGQSSFPLKTANSISVTYPYTVPDDCLWVMGDNRTNSADSRYFGPIRTSSVTGHAFCTYWPVNHMGVL